MTLFFSYLQIGDVVLQRGVLVEEVPVEDVESEGGQGCHQQSQEEHKDLETRGCFESDDALCTEGFITERDTLNGNLTVLTLYLFSMPKNR